MLVKLLGEILTTQLHARYKWDRGAAKSSLVFWRALKRPSTHLLSINARCNSGGNFATLAEPSGTTIAFGINDAGQIVGEFEDANGHGHGFLYSGGAFTNFDSASATTSSPALPASARSGSIGSSRVSAISAACPAKPICCCATARPAGWSSTTSTTINSPALPSSARSDWIGVSQALLRSAQQRVRPRVAQRQYRRVRSLRYCWQHPCRSRQLGG